MDKKELIEIMYKANNIEDKNYIPFLVYALINKDLDVNEIFRFKKIIEDFYKSKELKFELNKIESYSENTLTFSLKENNKEDSVLDKLSIKSKCEINIYKNHYQEYQYSIKIKFSIYENHKYIITHVYMYTDTDKTFHKYVQKEKGV